MSFKLAETYEDNGQDFEVWECEDCGKSYIHPAGADAPACCPCEFDNEGKED